MKASAGKINAQERIALREKCFCFVALKCRFKQLLRGGGGAEGGTGVLRLCPAPPQAHWTLKPFPLPITGQLLAEPPLPHG
jgi:hypothetical protein